MKKLLAAVLCLILTASLVAGCSSAPAPGSGSGTPAPGGSSTPAASGSDTVKIGIFEPASGENGGGRGVNGPSVDL